MPKNIKILLIISLLVIFRSTQVFASHDSLLVSVITIEPGNEIYTLFGHTAIRIRDHSTGNDEIYNFGTFDFNEPYFYLKFIKGNLKYSLSVAGFETYLQSVQSENRTMIEQVLSLGAADEIQLRKSLRHCYETNCRYYHYDFFFNNCATKVRDYLNDIPCNAIVADSSTYYQATFRSLVKPYIKHNYWLNLGINLALGKSADAIAGSQQKMFLPEYIHKTLKEKGTPFTENVLFYGNPNRQNNHSWWMPVLIAGLLVIMRFHSGIKRIPLTVLSSILGLTGLLILFISVFSEIPALTHNYNLYWTIPALLVVITRNRKPGRYIKAAYLVLLLLMLATWNIMPQTWSGTFIPWITAMVILLMADLFEQCKKATPAQFSC